MCRLTCPYIILFFGDFLFQINTNGILTFKHEFSSFLNIQFPLDYPAISVFYSNVDTSENDSSKVLYFQSNDDQMLDKASEYVRRAFSDAIDFQASAIVVVTWENVGYFDRKNDLQNTFQVSSFGDHPYLRNC